MAAQPDKAATLPKASQDAVGEFYKQARALNFANWNLREQMSRIDRDYAREADWTSEQAKAQTSNRMGDPSKFQNITLPVVMPAVENAVSYQSSIFLTGQPLFPVVSAPQFVDQALMLQALIDNQSIRGGWVQEFQMAFRDGFKYNMACVEVDWETCKTPTFSTDPTNGKVKVDTQTIYSGNRVRRRDMYNLFWDTRVPFTDVPTRGDFIGYTDIYTRTELKGFINNLEGKIIGNVVKAFESTTTTLTVPGDYSAMGYYIPAVNQDSVRSRGNSVGSMNWATWFAAANKGATEAAINYKDFYEVSVIYARIIPADFKLYVPQSQHPQIWKFIIVNHEVVIYAERQTNAHDMLPMLCIQPLKDGLEYQTKSLATNVTPTQQLGSAMWNSIIAARRRAISDRMLFNPLYVASDVINSDNPSAKMPIRPAGYGKPFEMMVYPIPFRDDQSAVMMQELPMLERMADRITGQNPARNGQFVKGNKTQHEYADIMTNSEGRDMMTALSLEAQLFTPLKEMLKINILQFQGSGEVYARDAKQVVQIDPVQLRKATLEFKLADGLNPVDKLFSEDNWTTAVQTIGSSPQIGQGYNIAPMFSYIMKTRGVDLRPFEKSPQQIQYEQALGSWQQMAQLAIEKGAQFTTPQPVPQQYGYDPNASA